MKQSLWIGTADIKDLYVSKGGDAVPFLSTLADLLKKGVDVRLIHAKEPGPMFREDFDRYPILATDLKEVLAEVLKDNELESEGKTTSTPKCYVYGIAGIAKLFGCSIPTAQRIKDRGELDDAISQIGGVIVVDAEYALDLHRLSKKHRNTSLKKPKK